MTFNYCPIEEEKNKCKEDIFLILITLKDIDNNLIYKINTSYNLHCQFCMIKISVVDLKLHFSI